MNPVRNRLSEASSAFQSSKIGSQAFAQIVSMLLAPLIVARVLESLYGSDLPGRRVRGERERLDGWFGYLPS